MKHKKIEKIILNIFRLMPIFCLLLFILYICLTGFTKVKANTYDNTNTENLTEETTTYTYPNGSYYKNILDFNQLLLNGSFVNSNNWISSGCSFSVSDNYAHLISLVTDSFGFCIYQNIEYIANHKYFAIAYFGDNSNLEVGFSFNNGSFNILYGANTMIDKNKTLYCCFTISNPDISDHFQLRCFSSVLNDYFYVSDAMLIDLTQMFGSGYEPSSFEDLNRYIDLSLYYDYTIHNEIIYNSSNIISSNYYIYNYGFLDNVTNYFNDYIFKYTDRLFNGSVNVPFNAFANAITLNSESIFYTYVKFSYLYLLYIFLIDILYLLYNIIVFIPKWLITEFEKRT